ncbi:MAG: Hsp20/alpha crystallin family protein [Nitrospirota bacterium]
MAKQEIAVRTVGERVIATSRLSEHEAPTTPLLDLYEVAGGLVVEVDLPGVAIADLRIIVSQNNLTIEGAPRNREDAARRGYLRVERSTVAFHRVVTLPIPVNPHAATARYERGVLTVTFPKIPDRRQQAIEIPVRDG